MSASPAARSAPAGSRVVAVTRPVPDNPTDLALAAPLPTRNLAFLNGGDGLVGWGVHASITVSGADPAAQIGSWFDSVTEDLQIWDEVGAVGTGPVVFASLGFDECDRSVAVIPAVVLGRRDGSAFHTVIGSPALAERIPIRSPGRISYADLALPVAGFTSAVATAAARVRAGELAKVVLAHDLEATSTDPVDERFLLSRLAAAYPDCWTFAVEGLVGASPEMLVRRVGRRILSRVLAGTAWAEHIGDPVEQDLMASRKNLAEHDFAVRSVAQALAPVSRSLSVPDQPHPLVLANLTHLATDITGDVGDDAPTALELAARLHPTAAVGGTPTDTALRLIRELEPFPRGRYAGPVGWMDTSGDGEFAIALRCAQVDGTSVRLMAGCGIVADSDPDTEAREAQVKMIPIRDALED